MHLYQYDSDRSHNSHSASHLILSILKHRSGEICTIEQLAEEANTTETAVRQVLNSFFEGTDQRNLAMTGRIRLMLAFRAARQETIRQVASLLTWQEFENFAVGCLDLAGFNTVKGTIVHGQGRKWQIDLTGRKGSMLLALDCKHWHSAYSTSRMSEAAKHQKDAVYSMLRDVKSRKTFHEPKLWALPIILTLFELAEKVIDGAVLVSLEKLSDFLNGVTPFSTDLPFIESDLITESPIC